MTTQWVSAERRRQAPFVLFVVVLLSGGTATQGSLAQLVCVAMNRDDFLARVREAARSGRAYRVHTQEVVPGVGYVGGGDDPPARLAAEVEAVGGHAWLVEDLARARRRLAELIEAQRPRTALCWQHPLLDALDVRGAVNAVGAQVLSYEHLLALTADARRAAILAANLGMAAADWAVAETGSLAVAAGAGQERSVTLLPPVLISVVDGSRIVPDLFDLFAKLQPSEAAPDALVGQYPRYELPSNLALITGPSKTGDIELQLTTGVHGPGEWHVIVIRQAVAPLAT
jgi:L-lactate dehydrogenase complex protein LldG